MSEPEHREVPNVVSGMMVCTRCRTIWHSAEHLERLLEDVKTAEHRESVLIEQVANQTSVLEDQNKIIATLTAENAALTQRVAELEAALGPSTLEHLEARMKWERQADAAMAEAQRLRAALEVFSNFGPDGYVRAMAGAVLAATTPAAASERRVAAQRVIDASREYRKLRGQAALRMVDADMNDIATEEDIALDEAINNAAKQVDLAFAEYDALDAPGGGA